MSELAKKSGLCLALLMILGSLVPPAAADPPASLIQSINLPLAVKPLNQYVVHYVLFGWDMPIDSGRAVTDFVNIVSTQLGTTIYLRSYSLRPRYAPQSYDQRPPATMINEVVNVMPPRAGTGNEVIMIFSSLLLPSAQGGSQAYFLRYLTPAGERNIAIVWGRNGNNLALPANPAWLPSMAAHEFGHFIGYQHEGNPSCIMNPVPLPGSSFRSCSQFPGAATVQKGAGNAQQGVKNEAALRGACIIATTAYGSELTPPVAFLRTFRDMSVRSSSAGLGFMDAFESWYYSFSPYVADFIAQHQTVRELTRLALYPLIGILLVSEKLQSGLGREAGVVVVGAFAAFTIGLTYFAPLAGILRAAFPRTRMARRTAMYGRLAVALALPLGALLSSEWLLSAGAVALVLISLTCGARVGSTILLAPFSRLRRQF